MGILKPLLSFKLPCLDIWGCEVSNLNRKKCNDLSFNKKKTVLEVWSYFTERAHQFVLLWQEYLSCNHINSKYFFMCDLAVCFFKHTCRLSIPFIIMSEHASLPNNWGGKEWLFCMSVLHHCQGAFCLLNILVKWTFSFIATYHRNLYFNLVFFLSL